MPVRDDLIAALSNIVGQAAAAGYSNPMATNDVYENYIWALCLQAARLHGAMIRYEDFYEEPVTALFLERLREPSTARRSLIRTRLSNSRGAHRWRRTWAFVSQGGHAFCMNATLRY
jgi:hypothetical protein